MSERTGKMLHRHININSVLIIIIHSNVLQFIQGGVKSVSIRNTKHNNILQFIQGGVKTAIYILIIYM